MNIVEKLEAILEQENVRYELFTHPVAYSSQRTAQAEHVPGREEAKVVILKANGKDIMVVLPATHHVDLLKMSNFLGTTDLRLETERKFAALFPGSELGAMPPFGHIYHVPVYVDKTVAESEEIVFNAGSHHEAIRMKYRDYERVEEPQVGDFAVRNK